MYSQSVARLLYCYSLGSRPSLCARYLAHVEDGEKRGRCLEEGPHHKNAIVKNTVCYT